MTIDDIQEIFVSVSNWRRVKIDRFSVASNPICAILMQTTPQWIEIKSWSYSHFDLDSQKWENCLELKSRAKSPVLTPTKVETVG